MVMRKTSLLAAALLCLAAPFTATGPVSAQNIGTVASSEPTLRGTPPGAGTRTLNLGSGVVQDERVSASASGRGQLMFLDQTTLSLAPNTTIVLDQFVFDPNAGTGQMGVALTEGALRFIGGTLSREQDATVTTPTATIGIRGSSALITFLNGTTTAIFLAGEQLCIIAANGQRTCTSRRGGVLNETGYLGRVDPGYLATLIALIDGAPTVGGGSGPGLGSGIDDPNPADRGPVSTIGEELDEEIFDDEFVIEDLGEFNPGDTDEEGGGGPGPVGPGPNPPVLPCNPLDPAPGCF